MDLIYNYQYINHIKLYYMSNIYLYLIYLNMWFYLLIIKIHLNIQYILNLNCKINIHLLVFLMKNNFHLKNKIMIHMINMILLFNSDNNFRFRFLGQFIYILMLMYLYNIHFYIINILLLYLLIHKILLYLIYIHFL